MANGLVCGEMAGDQQAVPLLVGMGLMTSCQQHQYFVHVAWMKKPDTAKMEEYAKLCPYRMLNNEEVLNFKKEYVNFD